MLNLHVVHVLTCDVFLRAGCPAPFVELATGCYYASKSQLESWTGSRGACLNLTGDLAVITSSEEQTAINGYLATVYPGNLKVELIHKMIVCSARDFSLADTEHWTWAGGTPTFIFKKKKNQ